MEDVLEVYHRPYDPDRPQICLDETSKQLVAESRGSIPMRPGRCKRVDPEYRRCGVTSVFMLSEPLAGKRHVRVRSQRTQLDFAEVIRELGDELYPQAETIVLVMDNLNTHTTASLYEAFEPAMARRLAEKLEIHYTPKHGSWLNMAEIELSILSRQCMDDYFENADQLTARIGAWERKRNEEQTNIDWRFTTADARIKLRKLYPST
jgi:transposase